jgi:hypothetical protein
VILVAVFLAVVGVSFAVAAFIFRPSAEGFMPSIITIF